MLTVVSENRNRWRTQNIWMRLQKGDIPHRLKAYKGEVVRAQARPRQLLVPVLGRDRGRDPVVFSQLHSLVEYTLASPMSSTFMGSKDPENTHWTFPKI